MKLLIKDRFFHNADVLRRFALSSEYQDSSKILTDVGWRGYRTEEFDLLDNKIINEASQNILKTVSKFYNLKGYSITSHFHISTEETKKTLEDFDNDKYHKDQTRCMECGCFLMIKARLVPELCPIGKWKDETSNKR